jgi:hypothetical protein
MDDPAFPGRPGLTSTTLRIMRYAMLAMLLLFGAFAYYQSTHRAPDDAPTNLSYLRWVGFGLCAFAMVGVGVLRQVRERASGIAVPTLGLVGSALAEASALFGAVFMVLGGDITVYALGLVVFLATWTLLPADSESA